MKTKQLSLNNFKVLTAMLLAVMIGGLTSCKSDDDDSVVKNVKPEDIIGSWYTEYDRVGVYGEGEKAKDYAKVVLYGSFFEGNTGVWMCLLVDADGNAVDLGDEFLGAGCEYTISDKGIIDITLTGSSAAVTLAPRWSMTYQDGQLVGKVRDNMECRLSRITEAQEAKFQNWMRQLGLGYDDTPETPETPEGTNLVDLSTVTEGIYYTKDGDILTGTLHHYTWGNGYDADCKVEIPDGAAVTLQGATIGGPDFCEEVCWSYNPAILCQGDAYITLEGYNEISGHYEETPCIYVKPGKKLVISCSNSIRGTLNVNNSGANGSAIGGGTGMNWQFLECGNICFRRCKIEAVAGGAGIPIGCTAGGKCGDISFEDHCEVHAWGNYEGVGIGCRNGGTCGVINIREYSEVIANGGWGGAPAIGASGNGRCTRVLTDGTVKAYLTEASSDPMPINAWINADVIQLNKRLAIDFNGYMIMDGLDSKRSGGIPAMKRNGTEFFIFGGS